MNLLLLLNEIQTLARNGLHYAASEYDRERYERLLELSTQQYAELLDAPAELIRDHFLMEIGYITPKVGANAAIFNGQGEILLMDRADGSGWCLPCGWVEPNEKPIETTVREAREETGLEIAVQQLVGVFTRLPSLEAGPHSMVAIVHLCDVTGGALTLSHEGRGLRYWAIEQVPHWHPSHDQYARAAHHMWAADHLLPAISD